MDTRDAICFNLIIIMLNLLIAFINDSYEKFVNFQRILFLFGKFISDYEITISLAKNKNRTKNQEKNLFFKD